MCLELAIKHAFLEHQVSKKLGIHRDRAALLPHVFLWEHATSLSVSGAEGPKVSSLCSLGFLMEPKLSQCVRSWCMLMRGGAESTLSPSAGILLTNGVLQIYSLAFQD